MKRALILGVAGQDGSYLAEYLLTRGYQVFGIVRSEISAAENLKVSVWPVAVAEIPRKDNKAFRIPGK